MHVDKVACALVDILDAIEAILCVDCVVLTRCPVAKLIRLCQIFGIQ